MDTQLVMDSGIVPHVVQSIVIPMFSEPAIELTNQLTIWSDKATDDKIIEYGAIDFIMMVVDSVDELTQGLAYKTIGKFAASQNNFSMFKQAIPKAFAFFLQEHDNPEVTFRVCCSIAGFANVIHKNSDTQKVVFEKVLEKLVKLTEDGDKYTVYRALLSLDEMIGDQPHRIEAVKTMGLQARLDALEGHEGDNIKDRVKALKRIIE